MTLSLISKPYEFHILRRFQQFQLVLILTLFLPTAQRVVASEIEFKSETILRGFEVENQDGEGVQGVPIYEYLRFDYGNPEKQVFSFHIHGWGRYDFGGEDIYEDNFDGELLYGYLEYLSPSEILNFKLGRQQIYYGIINESVDGIGMDSILGRYFSFSAVGGYTVSSEELSGSREILAGARAAFRNFYSNEIGVSLKTISNNPESYEEVGIDISLSPLRFLTINGISAWNLETQDWKEHSYEAGLYLSSFYLKPFYHVYEYKDFFRGGTNAVEPFRYLKETERTLTIFGGDISWQKYYNFNLGLRYKQYKHDLSSEDGNYYAVLIDLNKSRSFKYGAEMGIMDGDSVKDRYQLGRIYLIWDAPSSIIKNWFISSDFLYVHYDKEIYGKDRSLFASFGGGKYLIEDRFQLKLSGDYSSDPYFDSNIRFMCVLLYNY